LQGTSGAFARSLQSALFLLGFVLDQTVKQAKTASAPPAAPILREGVNCWRIAKAKRAAVLVDGADYYERLEQALRAAQKSILIVGWDFDARIKLRPQDAVDVTFDQVFEHGLHDHHRIVRDGIDRIERGRAGGYGDGKRFALRLRERVEPGQADDRTGAEDRSRQKSSPRKTV